MPDNVPGFDALCNRVLAADALEGDLAAVDACHDRDDRAVLIAQDIAELPKSVCVQTILGAGNDTDTADLLRLAQQFVRAAGGTSTQSVHVSTVYPSSVQVGSATVTGSP